MKQITKIDVTELASNKKLRVAAYCRVSTDQAEQLTSLEAQKTHYENHIRSNPEWEFAGLYYDTYIRRMIRDMAKIVYIRRFGDLKQGSEPLFSLSADVLLE